LSLCVSAIILAVLAIILFVPIGVGLGYEKGILLILKIGFIKLSKPITLGGGKNKPEKKEKKPEKREALPEPEKELDREINYLDFILELAGDFRRFMREKLSIEDLDINVRLGTGDAASTAVLTGVTWGLLANVIKLVDLLAKVKKPYYNVEPCYNDATFSVSARGILVSRLAYIIAVAIVLAYKYMKYKNTQKTKEETA